MRRRFIPLGLREAVVPLEALAVVLFVRLAVRRVSLDRLLAWLTPGRSTTHPREDSILLAATYTLAVLKVIGWPSPERCLPLAMCLYHFARVFGLAARFHCGVLSYQSNGAPRLKGHAWLTVHGRPLLAELLEPGRFTAVFSYPPAPTAEPGREPDPENAVKEAATTT